MKLTVIKWRDIPTQVMIKKSRREVEKVQLDVRFMEAVDSAATIADATDTDAYISDWLNEVIEIPDGDLKEPVASKAAELESAFTQNVLLDYVNNGGNFFIEMAEGLISNHNYEAKIIQLEALRYFVKNSTKSDFPVISKHLEAF